MNKNYTRL